MTFIAGAVVWAAYTAIWWGWEAVTNRVPAGPPDTFHWPSIRDLVSPARMAQAVPPQMGSVALPTATTPPPTAPAPGAATGYPTRPSL